MPLLDGRERTAEMYICSARLASISRRGVVRKLARRFPAMQRRADKIFSMHLLRGARAAYL